MDGRVTIAQDYDGVYVDDLGATFRRMLRIETHRNLLLDTLKEIGYQAIKQVIKIKPILHLVENRLDGAKPREEALEAFRIGQEWGARIVLITSNARMNEEEALSAAPDLRLEFLKVRNSAEKVKALRSMSKSGNLLLLEDDNTIAMRVAHDNIHVAIVGTGHSRVGSRIATTVNKNVYRLKDWSEVPALAHEFLRSGTNAPFQRQKSVA